MVNVRLTEAIDVDVDEGRRDVPRTGRRSGDDRWQGRHPAQAPRSSCKPCESSSPGTIKGSDKISLKANSIAFGGQTYEVVTAYVEAKGSGEGKKSARKIGGGVGLGAIVGGIAGGGQGAAIGAAVGGATGAVVASQGQEHLQLPAETRLQFQLSAAVKVKP